MQDRTDRSILYPSRNLVGFFLFLLQTHRVELSINGHLLESHFHLQFSISNSCRLPAHVPEICGHAANLAPLYDPGSHIAEVEKNMGSPIAAWSQPGIRVVLSQTFAGLMSQPWLQGEPLFRLILNSAAPNLNRFSPMRSHILVIDSSIKHRMVTKGPASNFPPCQ